MKAILFILVLVSVSCKTNISKEPTKVDYIYDHIDYGELIMDRGKELGNDNIWGVIKDTDGNPMTLAAIKLVVNDSVCVNAYSNFDGQFGVLFDKNRITTNSHFVIVFEGYSRKIVPFNQFSEKEIIVLDKKSAIVTHQEYRDFYESIRSCTR